MNHESTNGYLPSGGWGANWVGDADRGQGTDQPGGWIFNELPYIEQQQLHDLSSDGQRDTITAQQRAGAMQMISNPIPTINCPSRRATGTFPKGTPINYFGVGQVFSETLIGRSDYAANAGDLQFAQWFNKHPQRNYAVADRYNWCNTPNGNIRDGCGGGNEVSHLRQSRR